MRFLPLSMVLTAILSLGVSCSSNHSAANKLVIGASAALNLGNNNPVFIQRNANVWETLTELDDNLIAQPGLAQSWDVSLDGRRWIFHLKKGVKFHNGDNLNAGLVAANILRLKDHPDLDYYNTFASLTSVNAVDEFTISLVFLKPVVDLPSKLGHYFAGIFSPAAFNPDGKLNRPIGSGPYIFTKSSIGQYDLVVEFPQYYGGKPFFREIEFRIINDPAVRVMSLIRGDIDMIAHQGGVPASYVNMLKDKKDIAVAVQDVAITHYLLFNCARPPFSNPSCRDAFSRALDRTELVNLILLGSGVPAHDFLIEKAARWDHRRFPLRPEVNEQIKNRLAACNNEKPLKLLLSQSDASSWSYRHVADYLSDYFSRIGVSIRVEMLENGAWQKATQAGDFDLAIYPLSAPTGMPELLIKRLAFSKGMRVRGIGNTTHYSSARVDRLFQAAVDAPNSSAQEEAYNSLLDLLAEEKPFAPLYHERYYYAYRRTLSGVRVDPFLKLDLRNIRYIKE
jgi:peptide/nickel transport system substrate-binding protein